MKTKILLTQDKGELSRILLWSLGPFAYLLSKTFKLFNILIFWLWAYLIKEIQKRVMHTKFDIYAFITLTFIYQPRQVCGHVHVCYRYRFVSVCTTELIDVCACPKPGREFPTSYVIVLPYIKVQ